MDKQDMTIDSVSIMHIRPVFMCSLNTGEVCFMDASELRQCAETKRIPIDRVTKKPLEDYSQAKGLPFPQPCIEVNIDGLGEYIHDKLDELSGAVHYADMLKNRCIRNQIVFVYTDTDGIRNTHIADDLDSQKYMGQVHGCDTSVFRFHVYNDAQDLLTKEQAHEKAKSHLVTVLA